MSGFDFLVLFGLSYVVLLCEGGKINLPPGGGRLFFVKGSTAKIKWSFDESVNISKIISRFWNFASSAGRSGLIASISGDGDPNIKKSMLPGIAIENPATLVLKDVDLRYNGTYTFTVGGDVSGSSEVTVFIVENATVRINCSSTTTVNKGDDITCLCKGEGGNPPADVSWYCKGSQIGEKGKEKQILILRNINGTSNGTCTCKAQSHDQTVEKPIQVRVRPDIKPTITSFTTNPPESVVGQPTTIICVAIARPKPSYTIIHNGRRIVSTDNTYAISKVEWNDTGTYTCNATNALGNDLEFLNLTVGQPPTTFPTSKAWSTTVGTHRNGHKKKGGLGTGAIVGIVVGVLILVLIISGVIYWFKFKSKEKNHEEEGNAEKLVKPRHADANVYDTVTTGGDDGGASASTAPHNYATLEPPMTYAALDTVALQSSGSKKQNDGKEPPTQYASIDVGKVGKVEKD